MNHLTQARQVFDIELAALKAVRAQLDDAFSRAIEGIIAALKARGVKKGDRVTLYLPMIPAAAVAMLAYAGRRLGRPLPTALLYDQVTPRRLAAWLEEQGGRPPAAAASPVATPVSGFLAPDRPPAPRLDLIPRPAPPALTAPVAHPVAAQPTAAPGGFVPVAVVGYAGRFPGARTVEEFWALLREGRSALGAWPAARAATPAAPRRAALGRVRGGGGRV